MTGPSGGSEFDVQMAPADLSRLLRDVKAFGPELAKATRKRLRDAGKAGVKDIQRRVLTGTSHSNTGMRRGIAAGTKVSILTGARTAGIRIVTTTASMPGGKAAMVKAYNKPSFRHPVYGRDVWVSQKGRPYFGTVLDEKKPVMARAMEQALKDAADTIHGATVR